MKIKTQVIINTGLYQDIRPVIEIDTENYEEARKLIKELHKNFFGLLNGKTKEDEINEVIQLNGKMPSKLDLLKHARRGEELGITADEYAKLPPDEQNELHLAQNAHNRDLYQINKNKKLLEVNLDIQQEADDLGLQFNG
jgi:hypothetical protein